MWSIIISKLATMGTPLLFVVGGAIGGMFIHAKAFKDAPIPCPTCPTCPACICPDAVSVQPFEMEKMKGVKEFNYRPEFTGNISIAGVDSSMIRKYINEAIQKHCVVIQENKKRRR